MLRDKLVSNCVGIILNAVRKESGTLTFISDESQVNRKFFTRKEFKKLKLFRVIRVLYVLAMCLDRYTFVQLGEQMFNIIWEMQDEHEFNLLDELKKKKSEP